MANQKSGWTNVLLSAFKKKKIQGVIWYDFIRFLKVPNHMSHEITQSLAL